MTLILDAEGLERLESEKAWEKLSKEHKEFWLGELNPFFGQTKEYKWADEFAKETVKSEEAKALKIKANKTFVTALINAFGHKDPEGEAVLDSKGDFVPDTELTDYENVPYLESINDYFAREVLPHASDAYIDESFIDERDKKLGRVGYEINFNRYFYKYRSPRRLHDIDNELKQVEAEIALLLAEVATE
jgi:type I restriction enzyme M protein